MKVLVAQACPTLCDPMDYSLPGSSVIKILQARILEWIAIPFSSKGVPGLSTQLTQQRPHHPQVNCCPLLDHVEDQRVQTPQRLRPSIRSGDQPRRKPLSQATLEPKSTSNAILSPQPAWGFIVKHPQSAGPHLCNGIFFLSLFQIRIETIFSL